MPNELHTMPLKLERLYSSLSFRGMKWDERGAYLLILCEAWLKAGLIKADDVALATILPGISDADMERIKNRVIDTMFKVSESGELFNETQLAIYNNIIYKAERLSEAGRKGGLRQAQARLKGGLSNQNQNQSQNQSNRGTVKKFEIPSLEMVREYAKEVFPSLDAEQFINFYESKGWMIGKNKMKSWQAAVRTWKKSQNKQPELAIGQKHEQEGKIQWNVLNKS
jgi:uncharacterized protein YdaU (DUF1376 family)